MLSAGFKTESTLQIEAVFLCETSKYLTTTWCCNLKEDHYLINSWHEDLKSFWISNLIGASCYDRLSAVGNLNISKNSEFCSNKMVSHGDPKDSFLVLWIHRSQYYILLRKWIIFLSPNLQFHYEFLWQSFVSKKSCTILREDRVLVEWESVAREHTMLAPPPF